MRKKILYYIINETKKRRLILTSFVPTLEECDFLHKNKVSVIRSKRCFIYRPINYILLLDTSEFYRE